LLLLMVVVMMMMVTIMMVDSIRLNTVTQSLMISLHTSHSAGDIEVDRSRTLCVAHT